MVLPRGTRAAQCESVADDSDRLGNGDPTRSESKQQRSSKARRRVRPSIAARIHSQPRLRVALRLRASATGTGSPPGPAHAAPQQRRPGQQQAQGHEEARRFALPICAAITPTRVNTPVHLWPRITAPSPTAGPRSDSHRALGPGPASGATAYSLWCASPVIE
jgi:hypothetical protein